MAKLKRGDVVEYCSTHGNWKHLNGRIGVVRLVDEEGCPAVDWITADSPEADSDDHTYDVNWVRKIGEIELPEADSAV